MSAPLKPDAVNAADDVIADPDVPEIVCVAGVKVLTGANEFPVADADPGENPLLVAVTVTVAKAPTDSPVTVRGLVAPLAVPHVAVPALTVGAEPQK